MKNVYNEYYITQVYNVIVGKDYTQVIDIFSAHYPFCRRVFFKQREGLFYIHAVLAKNHNDIVGMEDACMAFMEKAQDVQQKLSNEVREKFSLSKITTFLYWHGKSLSQIAILCLVGWFIVRKIKQSEKSMEFFKNILMYIKSKV